MRSLLKTAAAVAFFLGLAGSAHALPPCDQACQAYCGTSSLLSCSSPTACSVHFQCEDGRSATRACACSAGCFLAGTKISMADGTEKPIEEIQVGDMVLAFDEKTGELKPDRVAKVHDPVQAEGYLVVNDKLLLTNVHPVLTPGGWKEIGTLEVGDKLIGVDKKELPIRSMRTVAEKVTVYNFATNPYATYVANGVIVHNKNPEPTE
ncbi:MAG TPA: Hint domain-containing protein [Candidatus Polarisedimenticolaceae bacterium]|nr:Hint domain-containing protein [Candidatus Polarisedimenticolaceae bacterium]